ncbi:MAG: aminotransferase class I/II-fold pyridoxal phosphate-dependent enzyme [Acidimicrobiales bacterium]|nr:aminotransferase class I/II-fold pyridoxal phosphate-dependent enzyme [Acidimicrobiales bacterium]
MQERIFLSAPDVGDPEREALLRAFDSNWIAPVGPELDAFEAELAKYTGTAACVALASGTAALHLALLEAGVKPGDEVVVQSFTFAATAFAVVHAGARPVFMDSDVETWAMDPDLLHSFLTERSASGSLPAAVIPVDLYGSCANYERLVPICQGFGIPLICDAAEALGSRAGERSAGSFGRSGVLSFNGNKIMTTSGGGALLGAPETVDRARYLATQARQPVLHYEHTDIGFNYRLSNLLAALGRAQLAGLEGKIQRRQEIAAFYATELQDIEWCPYGSTSRPNRWLTVCLLPRGEDPQTICLAMNEMNIEARPAWKPMHLQPIFAGHEMVGGEVSEQLYARGICLPSGSALSDAQLERVADGLRTVRRS